MSRLWCAFLAFMFAGIGFHLGQGNAAYFPALIVSNAWCAAWVVLRSIAHPTHTNDRGES